MAVPGSKRPLSGLFHAACQPAPSTSQLQTAPLLQQLSAAPKRAKSAAAAAAPPPCTMAEADTSDYECAVCLALLVDPVVGQCGHDFCRTCLDAWRSRFSPRATVSCPLCRQPAMAPGVHSLGVCVRLQKMIETQFPAQLAARRKDIEVAEAERACTRKREIDDQVDAVQQLMRTRYHAVRNVLLRPAAAATAPAASEQPTALGTPTDTENVWALRPQPQSRAAGNAAAMPSGVDTSFPNAPTAPRSASAPPSPGAMMAGTAASIAVAWPGTWGAAPQQYACPSAADGFESPMAPLPHPSWQQPEADAALRQATAQHLVQLLHRLRPDMEAFRTRLPNLVRKLEEGLYCTAPSREHYADTETLEARLQNLVRRLTHRLQL